MASDEEAVQPPAHKSVAVLVDMGFSAEASRRALQIKDFDMDQALNLLLEKGAEFVMSIDAPMGSSASGSASSSSKDVPQRDDRNDFEIPQDASLQELETLREQAAKVQNYEAAIKIRDHMKKIEAQNKLSADAQLLMKLEKQREQAAKEQKYEEALQIRDQITQLKLKMAPAKPQDSVREPSVVLGKRARPENSSPSSISKDTKKLKQNDLAPAAPAIDNSRASSSKDVPPQPKDEIQIVHEGSGSSGSKDTPPKLVGAASSSGSNDVLPKPVPRDVQQQPSDDAEVVVQEDAVSTVAESTKASSTDQTSRSKKPKSKKPTKPPVPAKTPKQYFALQREAVSEISKEKRKFPKKEVEVPYHPSNCRWKVATSDSDAKPDLTCIWNHAGHDVQPKNMETLLDVTIGLDKEACKKGLEYWWHQGRHPYPAHYKYTTNGNFDYKWKSRFDHLMDFDKDCPTSHVGKIFQNWGLSTETKPISSSILRLFGQDEYVLASMRNIEELKPKVTKFLASIGEATEFHDGAVPKKIKQKPNLFWGVIDERAISSLALPVVLMQNPKTFGNALQQKVPHMFDKWFTVSKDKLKKCQNSEVHRDMLLCLELVNGSEETVKGQVVSHWFRDGSISDQPFLFQKGKQPGKSFCEKCGRWVADRTRHLQKCLTDWKNVPYGLDDRDDYQSVRLFQQTLGLDIGVTVQFKYVDKDNVRLKLCANFESLLRCLFFMDYWPYDSVSVQWRILKNQSYSEDHVTTSHRSKAKTECNFTMKNSLDMPKAPSPSCFVHKLKDNQPHTLSWMYAREGRSHDGNINKKCTPAAFKGKQIISRRVAGSDVKVEVEVERSYDRIRGGILGDEIGYGKTACMIALIAQTHLKDPMQTTMAAWEKPYAKEYIFTNATLIVTPPNLFNQWSGEFEKFVDENKCQLNIITICTHASMKEYTMADFVEADVVLVSFRFFFSQAYQKYFDDDVDHAKSESNGDRYYTDRIIKCRHRIFDFLKKNKAKQLLEQNALFEAFYWKRVVFDEFHEVVQVEGKNRDSKASYCFLRQLQSRYHWGLTATPLLDSVDGVRKMASLLHVFLPLNIRQQDAQHFIDEYLRANQWDVDSVSLEEKWMKVSHTPGERALYLNQQRDMVGHGDDYHLNSNASERLLQFCSHFCPHGSAVSIGNAVQQVREKNSKEQQDLLRMKSTCEEIRQLEPQDSYHRNEAERLIVAIDKKMKELQASLRYLNNAIKSISQVKEGEEPPECSLCMEEMHPENTVILPCGHTFHEACVRDALATQARCPLCRAPTSMRQCTNVKELIEDIDKADDIDPQREELRQKIGSKMLAIVDLIKSIKKTEKIIVFIQWNRIRDSLADAIKCATGFSPHILDGSTHSRNKVLKEFQQSSAEKDRVMLLSIEQSATGVNLTCANHCILAHPMHGNHKHATDCEKQAIGRIRRQGQKRNCVVYRFYTEGTIEERLMKEHSKELKDQALLEDQDGDAQLNRYNEPSVTARAADAHQQVSGVPCCGTCDCKMDHCRAGSEELKQLNANRKRLQGDMAKHWCCNKCEKEFHSETTGRFACIGKPECDYDLCESCYNSSKGDDLNEYPEIHDIRARYAQSRDEFAIGFDANNALVVQRSLASFTRFGETHAKKFERKKLSDKKELLKQVTRWDCRFAEVQENAFENCEPPDVLSWSYNGEKPNEAVCDRWTRYQADSHFQHDRSLMYPFNVVDPELKKRREEQ